MARVEFDHALHRRTGERKPFAVGAEAEVREADVRGRQPGMSGREFRVSRRRLLVQLDRPLQVRPRPAIVQVTGPRVQLERLRVLGRTEDETLFGLGRQAGPQRARDPAGQVVPDREQVVERHRAIVLLGPDVAVGVGVDELHVDPHPIPHPVDGALHHVTGSQAVGDVAEVLLRVPELFHGRAGDDPQIGDAGELGQQIVVHAVGEDDDVASVIVPLAPAGTTDGRS